jgi:hypothetical protein
MFLPLLRFSVNSREQHDGFRKLPLKSHSLLSLTPYMRIQMTPSRVERLERMKKAGIIILKLISHFNGNGEIIQAL